MKHSFLPINKNIGMGISIHVHESNELEGNEFIRTMVGEIKDCNGNMIATCTAKPNDYREIGIWIKEIADGMLSVSNLFKAYSEFNKRQGGVK